MLLFYFYTITLNLSPAVLKYWSSSVGLNIPSGVTTPVTSDGSVTSNDG